jgi:hypothetical protein
VQRRPRCILADDCATGCHHLMFLLLPPTGSLLCINATAVSAALQGKVVHRRAGLLVRLL